MRKKLRLDVERLAVESFDTEQAPEEGRGTVKGQGAAPCTCARSCGCPTAKYWCAEIAFTVYSCDYTNNDSCLTP